MRRFALSFLFLLMLAGCSGEPSAGSMEKAMAAVVQEGIAAARSMVEGLHGRSISAPPVIEDFKGFDKFEKLACQPLENDQGWKCQFRFTATFNGRTETSDQQARFYQTESGWRAEMMR